MAGSSSTALGSGLHGGLTQIGNPPKGLEYGAFGRKRMMTGDSATEDAFPAHWFPHVKVFMHKRILIIDDSDSTRGLVREFLESRPDFTVCGEAVDGLEGIAKGLEL